MESTRTRAAPARRRAASVRIVLMNHDGSPKIRRRGARREGVMVRRYRIAAACEIRRLRVLAIGDRAVPVEVGALHPARLARPGPHALLHFLAELAFLHERREDGGGAALVEEVALPG